jgi:SAM-dependent methyltransferase
MYTELKEINQRPKPFQYYTAESLWNDKHTSEQMLAFHLNDRIDVSSRKGEFIERSVKWITEKFDITGKKVADFGCGPGLYTTRFAKNGAKVTGIDFSECSISFAMGVANRESLDIKYVKGNYLDCQINDHFDLITMIMYDYCALNPTQRKSLLSKFHNLLIPGGAFLLDVYSTESYHQKQESSLYEFRLMNGFWSAEDYYGFLTTFKYDDEFLIVDKYTIIEESRTRTIYNWLHSHPIKASR